jgi:hypothetical protein
VKLNPTIFNYNNNLYSLVRHDTKVGQWPKSKLSYSLNLLNDDLKVLSTKKCIFNVNGNLYDSLIRTEVGENKYALEDLKYFIAEDGNIFCLCNVLIQNRPRRFRVGLVKVHIDRNEIELVKILEVDKMSNDEKNWICFIKDQERYIIYSIFPRLVIYKMDKEYNLNLHQTIDTFDEIKNTDVVNDLNRYYKKLYLTPCMSPIKLKHDYMLLYCKKREKSNIYKYYYCILRTSDWKLFFINKLITSGQKKYLNFVNVINNSIYECWGLNDRDYTIKCKHFDGNDMWNKMQSKLKHLEV